MKTKNNLVIVLGASATALAIVRELTQLNGLNIIVACQKKGTACASKYIKEYWCCNTLLTLANKIQEVSLEFEIALIPSSDVFVEWICDNHKELSTFCHFDKSYSSQLALDYLDKNKFSEIIKSHGQLYQPNTHTILEFELMAEEQKYFPIFIKPKIIHKKRESIPGQKGVIIQNTREWKNWYKDKINERQDWLVQEIIAGSENNIMLFVGYIDDSHCTKYFTARKLRQYPAGFGSASQVVTEEHQDIVDMSLSLLKFTKYQGICSGEFKWCAYRKKFMVIEFNPRPALWYLTATASGCNIVLESVGHLLKIPVVNINNKKKTVVWKYGLKDMFSKFFYVKNKKFVLPPPDINSHLQSIKYKTVYPIFDLVDIYPMVFELRVYLMKAIDRLKLKRK